MNISDNIRYFVKLRGFTLKQFAELIGISYVGLLKSLEPNTNYTIDTLKKYAEKLGVSVSDLIDKPQDSKNGFDCTCPNCGYHLHFRLANGKQNPQ